MVSRRSASRQAILGCFSSPRWSDDPAAGLPGAPDGPSIRLPGALAEHGTSPGRGQAAAANVAARVLRLASGLRAERRCGRSGPSVYDINRHIALARSFRAAARVLRELERTG